MSWLQSIPVVRWVEFAIVAILFALAAGVYVGQESQIATLKTQLAQEKQGRAEDRATYAQAAASAAADNAAETNRRLAVQAKDDNDAIEHENALRLAAERNASASAGLLSAAKARLAATRRPTGSDPAAVAPGTSSAAPDVVFTDMLGWAVGRGDELAEALDLAHSRGAQCERAYESLTALSP